MQCLLSSLVCLIIHRSGLRRYLPASQPSADFSTVFSANFSAPSSDLPKHQRIPPGVSHVTFAARAPNLQNTSQLPQIEGFTGTCPLAPDVPRLISGFCSSPRSLGFGFLQTSPRDDALAVSLAFGSAKTWLPDFHRHSYVPHARRTRLRWEARPGLPERAS